MSAPDRLTPLDAAFLDVEAVDASVALEIATVAVLEGPALSRSEFVEALRARLPAVPRHRQRVRRVPLELAPPYWTDADLDLDYHVRRAALPEPGGEAELGDLVATVMSGRLDRERPLWQCWLVEGLPDGRWAVFVRAHHCLADGVGGYALLGSLLAPDPPPSPEGASDDDASSHPALAALGEWATLPIEGARWLSGALRSPRRLARYAAATARGLATLAGALAPLSPSSLTGPLGRQRRYRIGHAAFDDVSAVADAYDVTVNDVVVAAVTRALREALLRRGEDPAPDTVRALVPVSVRASGESGQPGNRLSWLVPMLPVDITGPVERLAVVHERLSALKHSREAEAGTSVLEIARHGPFGPVSWAVRTLARLPQRNINTVVTNVPGPREPLRLFGGQRILDLVPYVPLAMRVRTGVAVLSYAGQLSFGVTTDFASIPDADLLVRDIEDGVAELVKAAGVGGEGPA